MDRHGRAGRYGAGRGARPAGREERGQAAVVHQCPEGHLRRRRARGGAAGQAAAGAGRRAAPLRGRRLSLAGRERQAGRRAGHPPVVGVGARRRTLDHRPGAGAQPGAGPDRQRRRRGAAGPRRSAGHQGRPGQPGRGAPGTHRLRGRALAGRARLPGRLRRHARGGRLPGPGLARAGAPGPRGRLSPGARAACTRLVERRRAGAAVLAGRPAAGAPHHASPAGPGRVGRPPAPRRQPGAGAGAARVYRSAPALRRAQCAGDGAGAAARRAADAERHPRTAGRAAHPGTGTRVGLGARQRAAHGHHRRGGAGRLHRGRPARHDPRLESGRRAHVRLEPPRGGRLAAGRDDPAGALPRQHRQGAARLPPGRGVFV